MKIAVVGLGYVGMSLSVLLSEYNEVCALDISETRVQLLNNKISPINDEDIQQYLTMKPLNLTATTHAPTAFKNASYIIVATPTDFDPVSNYFDTSSVESVVSQAHEHAPDAIVVIKSTVPVGFTEKLCLNTNKNILFSPEFLREGRALHDNLYPSRIIVGIPQNTTMPTSAAQDLANLLTQISLRDSDNVIIMGAREAEAVKLFSNTYLAMRVAFFNELDSYAEYNGLNTNEIISGVCLDTRIGNHYNNPSFGYGGYCLPKDTRQLLANYANVPNSIMHAIVEANQIRKDFIAKQVLARNPKKIGVYRLAMKTNSDNIRHSSIQGIIENLKTHKADIILYEPILKTKEFMGCHVETDLEKFKAESDIILANRFHKEIADTIDKVYTRDLWMRD